MLQFDWTTFILEIINFLVLIWILQRLLYRPVLSVLATRQQKIKDETAQAQLLRKEAEALQQQYQSHLLAWDQEQEDQRHQLQEELAKNRLAAVENLKQTLADEESKWQSRNAALTVAHEAALLQKAGTDALQQAAALLHRLASPSLTQAIVGMFLEDLPKLPSAELTALRKAASLGKDINTAAEIISAHALTEADCTLLSQALVQQTGLNPPFNFSQDPALIAGIRVLVGECQLDANIADELRFFNVKTNHA